MLNKTSSNHSEILNRNTVALRDRLVWGGGEVAAAGHRAGGGAENGEEKAEKRGEGRYEFQRKMECN